MRVRPVSSRWIVDEGLRLDAAPYLSGAMDARMTLEALRVPRDTLSSVTMNIFHAGRESRTWVEAPEYGVPFLSSSDILKADLGHLPLLSKKQVARNPGFLIRHGWTLITRSGTIGRMVFVRPDMDGMACSEHAMRVVPDEDRVPPGYLHAFLRSRFGIPMIVGGTYGSIIQSIEPDHIAELPVPRFGVDVETHAHKLIEAAGEDRSRAVSLLNKANETITAMLGSSLEASSEDASSLWTAVRASRLAARLDGYYYSSTCLRARDAFDEATNCDLRILGDVADVRIPGIFKRRYADEREYGYPYITGADVFQIAPTSERYLMRSVAEEYGLVVYKEWILIQEAGQLGGLIGRSVLVGEHFDGFAVSNNMVRIQAHDTADTGYIFAVLNSGPGVTLISREAAGSSIPHLDASRIRNIVIPWAKKDRRVAIGELVIEAIQLRDRACKDETAAREVIEKAIEEAG